MIKRFLGSTLLLGGLILFFPLISQAAIGIASPDSFIGNGTKDSGTPAAIQINIIDEEPGLYYLKAYFYPPDNAYARFSYVWHPDTQDWISTWQRNDEQRRITISETRNWQGEIQIKTDIEKAGYLGAGDYILKIKASSVTDNKTIEITKTVNITEPSQPPEPAPPAPPAENETPPVTTKTNIILNELLPNPLGKDTESEFIELKNLSNFEVNLAGWQIKDAADKVFIFGQEKIAPQGFLATFYSRSKISLNNSGQEAVFLYDPQGQLIDSISYQGCVEGFSFNSTDQGWHWSTMPTPGFANIIITTPEGKADLNTPEPDTDDDNTEAATAEDAESENEAAPRSYKQYSSQVYINEFIPDPEGTDQNNEWIELYNSDSETIDLSVWQIDDAQNGSASFKIPEGILIEPGQYLIFGRTQTKIALNNNGDKVRLFYPNENLAQEIEYLDAEAGWSVARQNTDKYIWTSQPTPGQKNIISQQTADQLTPAKFSVTPTAKNYQAQNIPTQNVLSQDNETNKQTVFIATAQMKDANKEESTAIEADQLIDTAKASLKNQDSSSDSSAPGKMIKTFVLALIIAGLGAVIIFKIKHRLH